MKDLVSNNEGGYFSEETKTFNSLKLLILFQLISDFHSYKLRLGENNDNENYEISKIVNILGFSENQGLCDKLKNFYIKSEDELWELV